MTTSTYMDEKDVKIRELEATVERLEAEAASGPERDLADLERLAREWGMAAARKNYETEEGAITVSWGDPDVDMPDEPKRFYYYVKGVDGTRAEALALLKGDADDSKG